jgi:hypothetical protein
MEAGRAKRHNTAIVRKDAIVGIESPGRVVVEVTKVDQVRVVATQEVCSWANICRLMAAV